MPVKTALERNSRVVMLTYSDPLDMVDLIFSQDSITHDVLDKASKPIHAIADLSALTHLPSNILSNTRRLAQVMHPMSGTTVFVTNGVFIGMMAAMLIRLAPRQDMIVCRTLIEAWGCIDERLAKETAKELMST